MTDNQKNNVYWMLLDYKDWHLYIAATDDGLCYIGSPDAPFAELQTWVAKKLPNYQLVEDKHIMRPYEVELIEYLSGKRDEFTIPMDFRGTEFQRSVWQKMMEIPFGQTASYTDVANQLNRPDAVRAIGTAVGANPMLITIPCHRLFGKDGRCRGYRGGLEMKGKLLDIENIKTKKNKLIM